MDFRQLDKKIATDRFPIPRIEDIIEQLGREEWFSVLDLKAHSAPIRYHLLFREYHLAWKSAQQLSKNDEHGIHWTHIRERVFLYMDDVIIIGCLKQHHHILRQTFVTSGSYKLQLNTGKWKIFRKEVPYLGHKITNNYQMIRNMTLDLTSSNSEEVKRFIPNFAEIAQPLNKLTRKNVQFN